mmetsp:Transcript_45961/g.132543  ORF Transcript_45961/g.132543 Transcript_45961/m.132543 type:complete len:217 (-) Transcript_45961:88-738(-)
MSVSSCSTARKKSTCARLSTSLCAPCRRCRDIRCNNHSGFESAARCSPAAGVALSACGVASASCAESSRWLWLPSRSSSVASLCSSAWSRISRTPTCRLSSAASSARLTLSRPVLCDEAPTLASSMASSLASWAWPAPSRTAGPRNSIHGGGGEAPTHNGAMRTALTGAAQANAMARIAVSTAATEHLRRGWPQRRLAIAARAAAGISESSSPRFA